MTARKKHPFSLTDREVEILGLVSEGLPNADIARKLYLAPDTVKSHLRRISKRMGCGERGGMVGLAYRTGVLKLPSAPAPLVPQPVVLDAVVAELLLIREATSVALRTAGVVQPGMPVRRSEQDAA